MSDGTNEQPDYDDYTRHLIEQYNEIAQLAGALAHEIKNPLSVIRMNVDLLSEDLEVDEPINKRRARQKIEIVRSRKIHALAGQQGLQVLLHRLLGMKADGRCIGLRINLREVADDGDILIGSEQPLLDIVAQAIRHSGIPSRRMLRTTWPGKAFFACTSCSL